MAERADDSWAMRVVHNHLPRKFESYQVVSYALADAKGTILTYEGENGRYLALFVGVDIPPNAEAIVAPRLPETDCYDGRGISFVMMLQTMFEDMIDDAEFLAGFDMYTGDIKAPPIRIEKYELPSMPHV